MGLVSGCWMLEIYEVRFTVYGRNFDFWFLIFELLGLIGVTPMGNATLIGLKMYHQLN